MLPRIVAALRRRQRPEARIERAYARSRLPVIRASRVPQTACISLVLPVFDTPADILGACIASVQAQTYSNWQLCIADDASTAPHVAERLAGLGKDTRVAVTRLPLNGGIVAASNAALLLARGDLVGFLDHDDVLAPHALARMAATADLHPAAQMFFSDEDQLVDKRHVRPYFKPGCNLELLLGQNMVGHLALYRKPLLDRLGGLSAGLDGAQDWDLALRAARQAGAGAIVHVPEVLYHWRQRKESFSAAQSAAARLAGVRAVQEQLPPGALAQPDDALPQWVRVVYPVPQSAPLVSIVTKAGSTIPKDPAYGNVEILHGEGATATKAATGDILLFLAPHLRSTAPGWLRELVSHAIRPGLGAVGGRIDGQDGRIAQSGLVLDPRLIAQTLRPGSDANDPGYRGQFLLARNVSAASLDCLAIRRVLFEDLGGLDPECGPYGDVDLCLRAAARGLSCVWTPHARLTYTRPPRLLHDAAALRLMQVRWGAALARDPYLNPNLVVRANHLALSPAPWEKVFDA